MNEITYPPWIPIAQAEEAACIAEVPGPEDNPRILEYWTAVNYPADHDEVPWCSAFVNWVMREAGQARTKNPSARSWLHYGVEIKPKPGAIVVLKRGRDWMGHVGFYLGMEGSQVRVLGGNQGDRVCVALFDPAKILGFRWPETYPLNGVWPYGFRVTF